MVFANIDAELLLIMHVDHFFLSKPHHVRFYDKNFNFLYFLPIFFLIFRQIDTLSSVFYIFIEAFIIKEPVLYPLKV